MGRLKDSFCNVFLNSLIKVSFIFFFDSKTVSNLLKSDFNADGVNNVTDLLKI